MADEGDIEIDVSDTLSPEKEAEAWKIAQLAATLMSGRFARSDTRTCADEAKRLLDASRDLLRVSTPS